MGSLFGAGTANAGSAVFIRTNFFLTLFSALNFPRGRFSVMVGAAVELVVFSITVAAALGKVVLVLKALEVFGASSTQLVTSAGFPSDL